MAKWLAKEFDWDTGRYTGRYYDIAEAGIVAVFVDSFYGDDTAAGTAAAPFKTLSKAITTLNSTGADGSRIFMNGIFSETLPTQTYWYEFIGCGGGKNGKVVWLNEILTNIRPISGKDGNRIQGIITINYNDLTLWGANIRTIFNNCFLIKTGGDVRTANSAFYNCILKNFWLTHGSFPITRNFYNCILYDFYKADTGANFTLSGTNNYIKISDISVGTIIITSTYSITSDTASFLDVSGNNFNVRITSPLLQAGPIDEITGIASNVGGVEVGLPYNGITPEFTTEGGATITDLTIDSTGRITITAPATTGTLETALMDLGNIYPLENIDLFNVFDFLSGEITQGVFETFSSPRMALTIKLKYGLTSAEVDDCPWLLIEYGKQPTFSGIGASRVGNAADTFDPDTFQTITCRYMKLFVTLQNNS